MVVSIVNIVITPNTICDNLVDFPKSGHICDLVLENRPNCHVWYLRHTDFKY